MCAETALLKNMKSIEQVGTTVHCGFHLVIEGIHKFTRLHRSRDDQKTVLDVDVGVRSSLDVCFDQYMRNHRNWNFPAEASFA